MDRNFARALKLVLAHEGGWADNPADPGGATMKGVTLTTFRRYVKAKATKADLRQITDAQIATVYRRHYWDAISGAELPDGVDYAVFDFAVNSGPARAAKFLQAVLGVVQDGRVGPDTLAAARARLGAGIINQLCDDRMAFLRKLRTWGTFGKGWTSRVTAVRRDALAMLAPQTSPFDWEAPKVQPKPKTPPAPVPVAKRGFLSGVVDVLLVLFRGWR